MPPCRPVFPGKNRKRKAMLWADLESAGIKTEMGRRVIDLHAL
jgi:hypothetical protein